MKNSCLECGNAFVGRSDKKFCDTDCRSSFHNKKMRSSRIYVHLVHKKLRINRCILQSQFGQKKTNVNHHDLLRKGFDFDYMTNIYDTQKGKRYIFCYDFGYLSLDNDRYAIVKKGQYV